MSALAMRPDRAAGLSTPMQRLLDRLPDAKKSGREWVALCPAHGDHSPSLSIREADDGRVLMTCGSRGCKFADIVHALGLEVKDTFAPRIDASQAGHAVVPLRAKPGILREHGYTDEHGELLYQVLRYDTTDRKERFKQRRPDGRGGWIWKLGDVRRVPYRLPEVVEAVSLGKRVFVVEGEKDVETMERLGYIATTNVGGAEKWRDEYSTVLRGADVVILPDNDAAGLRHAHQVTASLRRVGATVRWLVLPGLPPKGDVSDWLAAGNAPEKLARLIETMAMEPPASEPESSADAEPQIEPRGAVRPGVSSAVLRSLADIEPREVEWLWHGRIPLGTITIIDGNPGLGKGHLTLDLAARVTRGHSMPDGSSVPQGRVVLMTAEDSLATTIRPRLEVAGADLSLVEDLTVRLPDGMVVSPAFPQNVLQLREALEQRGDVKLVLIDPISAFLSGEVNSFRDQDVRRVMAMIATVAEEANVAIVFVRHLTKSRGGSAITRGGGSIAFSAASRSTLLVSPDPQNPEQRVLASVKNNLAKPPASLAFHIQPAPYRDWMVSRIAYDGTSQHTAEDLIAALDEDADARTERTDAEDWLRDYLRDGEPKGVETTKQAARAAGHTHRTLERAAKSLAVKRTRPKVPGPWYWQFGSESHTRHPGEYSKAGEYGEYGEYEPSQ